MDVFHIFLLVCHFVFQPTIILAEHPDSVSQPKCTNRLEFRHEIKKRRFVNCKELLQHNPLCGVNFTVAWSDFQPYVFMNEHTKKVGGILPTMLNLALESCCFDCNKIIYDGPYEHMERFFLRNVTMAIPAQTSMRSEKYLGLNYIHMLPVKSLSIFAKKLKRDPVKMGRVMLMSILNTWPLLVLVLTMSCAAGVCVWLLDSKWNANEFPETFPRGPLEGVWWAFVSMTTVGYGDKTPKGPIARVFAVFWMLVGITLCSMYTASLTGSLTSVIYSESMTPAMFQKKIAILNQTSVGMIGMTKVNANPVPYESLEEIVRGVLAGEAEGFALDDYMANFFKGELDEKGLSEYKLLQRIMMDDISFGMVAMNATEAKLFKYFYINNDDNRELMANLAMAEHQHGAPPGQSDDSGQFFTANSPLYVMTIIALVSICVIFTLIGLLIKHCLLKKVYDGKKEIEEGIKLLQPSDVDYLKSVLEASKMYFEDNGNGNGNGNGNTNLLCTTAPNGNHNGMSNEKVMV